MRRRGDKLTLTTEHRAAPSQDDIPLELAQTGEGLALAALSGDSPVTAASAPTAVDRVLRALEQIGEPASAQRVREVCGMRTASVGASLASLIEQGIVAREGRGYRLTRPQAA